MTPEATATPESTTTPAPTAAHPAVQFHLDAKAGIPAEGYALDVTASGIEIKASHKEGLFYGGVTLWHNTGKGHFVEVTDKAGFGKHTGWTLDIGHGDFNNDGFQDIYLACDYGTDRIFFNNGNGTFTDATEKSIGSR